MRTTCASPNWFAKGLTEEGHSVIVLQEGRQGLAAAKDGEYDVILLDVWLPGLTGFEIANRLRLGGDPTPVLMLTARDSTDDYLTKPFSFEVLLARNRRWGVGADSASRVAASRRAYDEPEHARGLARRTAAGVDANRVCDFSKY